MAKRPHKYGAKPTTVDGVRFASMKEARRYQELKLLERAGEITGLHLQPFYALYAPRLEPNPAAFGCEPIGKYVADFGYFDRQGRHVVEDVKGFKTPLYRWKKKHVEAQYGIEIREV